MSKKSAITKTQAAIIGVIIIGASMAGIIYFMIQPTPPPRDTIKIGWAHGLTGPLEGLTPFLHPYYKWIIEDYNAKGGLYVPEYGRRINITYVEYDDQSNIDLMRTLTEKLITEDKVDLLFAPCSTAFCYAAFPLYEQYKYPVVALSFGSDIAGEQMKTGAWQYSFSVLGFPSEAADQVVQLFKYIDTNMTNPDVSLKSVGIVYVADQHGVEYGGAIYNFLVLNGISVPVFESYPMGPATLVPQINKLKDANVDVAMLVGYDGGLFLTECIAQSYNPKLIFTGPGMEIPFVVYSQFTPAQANGTCYYDGWPATAYKTTELAAWAVAHGNRSNPYIPVLKLLPFPASATLYAGLECVFKAVEKVGLDRTKIAQALRTDTFDTIVGNAKLRPGYSMQCELAGTITQWQGGDMMEVIWPLAIASANIIYPKPIW